MPVPSACRKANILRYQVGFHYHFSIPKANILNMDSSTMAVAEQPQTYSVQILFTIQTSKQHSDIYIYI